MGRPWLNVRRDGKFWYQKEREREVTEIVERAEKEKQEWKIILALKYEIRLLVTRVYELTKAYDELKYEKIYTKNNETRESSSQDEKDQGGGI